MADFSNLPNAPSAIVPPDFCTFAWLVSKACQPARSSQSRARSRQQNAEQRLSKELLGRSEGSLDETAIIGHAATGTQQRGEKNS
jgi:hypothetical protein